MSPLCDKNWYVIINPIAGSGSAMIAWHKIEALFERMGLPYHAAFTKGLGHGAEIAQAAALKGYRDFIICGGDGTVHEITNGLMRLTSEQRTSICFAVFPCGTGNDFARHFKMPKSPKDWMKCLESAFVQPIDMGRIVMRGKPPLYFANEAGIGLQYEVAQGLSLNNVPGGRFRYVMQTLKSLFSYHGVQLTVGINDSASVDHLWNLTFANGRYLGGGFQLCPDADPTDGKLSYTKIHFGSKWQLIRNIVRFFNGRVDSLSFTLCGETSKILVEPHSLKEVFIEVDGEVRGSLPAEFSVINNALNIYIPS